MNHTQQSTLQSELLEDWQIIRPVLIMLVLFLAIIGLIVVIRNIIRMYKEHHKK